jgi:hypothetical protein
VSVLLLLDESSDEPGWYNVLPLAGRVDGSLYPDVMLEWAPTTQPTDASQTWVNITDRLRLWDWGYGRNDELATFEAGTGSVVLDNRDRELDPSYDAGAWFGNIKPRKMFRLRYRWNGTVYPGFVSYARGLPQTYPATGFDSVVQVDLVDAFAILQGVDLVVGFTRPAELSGARIEAVLDAIGVPAALRDVDTGTVTVDAINVDTAGTSGLGHAKAVALDSEMGSLFVAKDGKVTFHDYERRLNASVLHEFSDDGADLPYTSIEPAFDETYLWNYIRTTGADGDTITAVAEDTASQDDYFIITKTLSTQLAYEPDVLQVAQRYALKYAQPELRLPALPLNGAASPDDLWPVLLDLEVSDRVTVERFGDAADPMLLTQNVEGIRHACQPGGPWVTAVPTSPADTRTYFILDDATYGQLDDATQPIA